jgi:hypothetical protein
MLAWSLHCHLRSIRLMCRVEAHKLPLEPLELGSFKFLALSSPRCVRFATRLAPSFLCSHSHPCARIPLRFHTAARGYSYASRYCQFAQHHRPTTMKWRLACGGHLRSSHWHLFSHLMCYLVRPIGTTSFADMCSGGRVVDTAGTESEERRRALERCSR